MIIIALGFIVPRAFDVFIPLEKQYLADTPYAPQVTILGMMHESDAVEARVVENDGSSEDAAETMQGKKG